MIIGHIADIHLGVTKYSGNIIVPPGLSHKELGLESHASVMAADTARMLEESVVLLASEGVRRIVLAGDVFDVPKPSNRDLAWAASFFARTTREGIEYIVTSGDHDTPGLRDATPLDTLANTISGFHYPPRHEVLRSGGWRSLRLNLGDIVFYAMPFIRASREKRRDIIRKLNKIFRSWRASDRGKPVVLVAHYGLAGFTHEDDVVGAPEELPPVDYVAMGHVHARHIVLEGYPAPFAYPGSLIPVTLKEARRPDEKRGPLLVDLEPGSKPRVREVEVEPPRCYLAVKATLDSVENAIADALRGRRCPGEPPFVHLTVLVRDSSEAGRRNLRGLLEGVARGLNVIVRIHEIIPLLEGPGPKQAVLDAELGDLGSEDIELEVIASRLAGDRELASLVLELKETLASNNLEEAERIALQLVSPDYRARWEKILGQSQPTPTPLQRRAEPTHPRKPRETPRGTPAGKLRSRRRGRSRGLDAFLS